MGIQKSKIVVYHVVCDSNSYKLLCERSLFSEFLSKTEAEEIALLNGYKKIKGKWYCYQCVICKGLNKWG